MHINNTETAVLNTINLKTINTYSNNLVPTFLNPSSLKDSTECIAFESSVNVISVPPKIWRPKQKTNYKPMICTDVDEDLYIFKSFGKSMKRAASWTPRPRSDVIPWNTSLFQEELDNNFNIGSTIDDSTRNAVIQIIKDNWDSFCEVGAARPMLDFEFCIDTGDAKPTCCRQPKYGVHEGKIMSKQISDLENNNWIRDCTGPWGALLLLAAKPHQESCTNIDQFVWRLCVSYRALNGVTRSFEFPIPRCSDSIEDLGDSYGKLYFISLDARSGYH